MDAMKTSETLCPDAQGKEGPPSATQVPIGWQRQVDHARVVYISPSGSVLACLEQVKSYLLADGTCKCGLECPLILTKVFNFDPGVAVRQRTAEDARADEDVTKLCIHKRKIIAVATLHKSMESPNPSFILTSPSGDRSSVSFPHSLANRQHDGSTGSSPEDSNMPYQTMHGQKHFQQHDMGSPPQQDLYSNYHRIKHGSSEHTVDRRSPYRRRLSVLLSPSKSSSHPYLDGSPSSSRGSDSLLLSPELSAGFQVSCSPGKSYSTNSAPATPLSPLRASHLSSPPSSSTIQSSCAMMAPSSSAKSPAMRPPSSCGFPQQPMDVFHHKPPPVPQSVLHLNPHHHQHHPPPPPPLSHCVSAKQQVTSEEKDPLGILDPIPSNSASSSLGPSASTIQTNSLSQVSSVNVNMPSTIVPLPSNLPLPTAKLGHAGHSSRSQYHSALHSSVSAPSITSAAHMSAASSLIRLDAQHQAHGTHATSVSMSDHGEFSGLQASFGLAKVPSRRSLRSSFSSPYSTAMAEMLQSYKDYHRDNSNHFLGGGTKGTRRKHSSRKYSGLNQGSSGGGSSGLLKGNPDLMGLNNLLNKHGSSQPSTTTTFPASSLLSAAAKAQTASSIACGELEMGVLPGGGLHGMNSNSVTNSHPEIIQSGRAALRDKLMAQQRNALHKKSRHLSSSNHSNNLAFSMFHKGHYGGSGSRFLGSSSEFVRKQPQQPQQQDFKAGASMAQLLQNMSSTHNGISQMGHYLVGSSAQPQSFGDGMLSAGAPFQSQQGLPCSQDALDLSQFRNRNMEQQQQMKEDQHSAMMNPYQMQAQQGEQSWMSQGGQPANAVMGSQVPHKPHQQLPSNTNHYYALNTPHLHGGMMVPNGYAQTLSGAPHK
ncbi:methyl-CpG-binding domain protein 5-like [Engraulis encrasicolus]|uniref:methyl-CpG-binding domain protein 5-like n=1 Tax=Engraulis encrasicolus TaxID=184585 RepID=UPI002FD39A7B